MNDTAQTLIRSVLKVGAGYAISKGIMDDAKAEVIIAGILGAAAVVWGLFHRTKPTA